MSSIYLKDGWYWLQRYVLNPDTGRKDKRQYKKLNTRDRNQALLRQADDDKKYVALHEQNALFPMRPLSLCIKEYLDEKEHEISLRKRSINTYRSDEISLGQFKDYIKDAFGDVDVREINKMHILKFKDYRESLDSVNSSSTVSLNLRVIRSFLSDCMEKDYIQHHPFENIKIKKSLMREERPIGADFDKIVKIFKAIVRKPYPKENTKSYGKHRKKKKYQWIYDQQWFAYAIFIVLNTGMRIGEVLMIKWKQEKDDIGVGHSYSYAYLSKDMNSLTIHFKRSKRTLPVKHLKPIFKKIPRTYEIAEKDEVITVKKTYVFESDRTQGTHHTTTAAKLWKKFVVDYELNENWTIHSLRHGVASALLNSGKTHFEVGNVLGHSTLEMIDRYGTATLSNLEETMAVLHRPKKKANAERPKSNTTKNS